MILQTLAENVLQQSRTNAKTAICAELHSKSQSALSLFTNRLFHRLTLKLYHSDL